MTRLTIALVSVLALVALVLMPQGQAAPAVIEKMQQLVRRGIFKTVSKCTSCYKNIDTGGSSSSSSSEEKDDCFPGDARVQLEDGSSKRMRDVCVGDRVQVSGGAFSDVFIISHNLPKAQAAYLQLVTQHNHILHVTPEHFVYVNGTLAPAASVSIGDRLTLADGNGSAVVSVATVWKDGVFNVLTLDGDIVVDGVLASTYGFLLATPLCRDVC